MKEEILLTVKISEFLKDIIDIPDEGLINLDTFKILNDYTEDSDTYAYLISLKTLRTISKFDRDTSDNKNFLKGVKEAKKLINKITKIYPKNNKIWLFCY